MKETKDRLRTGTKTLRLAALALSVGAAGSALAGEDLVWGNADGNFSAPGSWTSNGDLTGYTSIYDWQTGALGKNIRFDGTAAGKTVTMDIADDRVWNCWFYNGATPVIFDASDAAKGFTAYWGMHLAVAANDVASLTVKGGTYATPTAAKDNNASSWGTGNNAKVTLNLEGGKIDLWGATGNDSLYLTSGTGVESTINISGGTLAVSGGDMTIGSTGDSTSQTTITISNGGELSVGTESASRWLKLSSGGTTKTTIDVNNGGTLSVWHLRHDSAGESAVTLNGGTLKVLGRILNNDTHYGLIDTQNPETFTVSVGENGGILNTNGKSIDIYKEISGTGTLRIIGGGSVNFTVAPTCTVVADADTTVTGATLSSAAISITAPSSDWSSKTQPTTAGTKTVTSGNWATYANGGNNYKQTLGSDTAYVSIVNVADGASDAIIYAIASAENSSYNAPNADFYTLINDGGVDQVGGCFTGNKNYNTFSLPAINILTQIGGDTQVNYIYGAGYGSAKGNADNDGNCNVGITICDSAKVLGTIVGAWYPIGNQTSKLKGNTYIQVNNVQDNNTAAAKKRGDNNTGVQLNPGWIVGGCMTAEKLNGCGIVEGSSNIKIDVQEADDANFVKSIVGGSGIIISHKNTTATQTFTGDSSVTISLPNNVTFTGNIYGGDYRAGSYGTVTRTGNSSVTINGGTYSGTIIAGSSSGCSHSGNATLTISGGVFASGSKLQEGTAEGTKTLAFTGNVDVSSATISGFDKITIAKGKTVTISSSQVSMFSAQGLSVEENNGIYTAKYAPKYFWVGEGGDKNWSNAANWKVGDTSETATTADSAPTASDPVTISTADSIVIDSADCAAQQITVDAAVTFTGNVLAIGGATGSGTITLGDGAGFAVATKVTIPNNIAVTASAESPAIITASSGVGVTLTGTFLESTGYLKFTGNASRHYLNLDANNFKGTIEIDVGSTAGNFMTTASGSSAVKWVMTSYTGSNSNSAGHANLVNQGSTGNEVACEFGSLTGTLYDENPSSHGCVIFTVGALCGSDETMNLTYRGTGNTGRDSAFKMVGEGTFAINATNVRRYECDSGTIELMTANSLPRSGGTVNFNGGALKLNSAITSATDPSSKFVFVDGKTAILDDGGVTREFATAIGNNTSANFVKKGSGTLTLTQAPAYTGTTTVTEGVLKMPVGSTYTLGENTVVMTNGEYLYFTPVVSATTENAATVIAGATQYEVVSVSGSTLDLSGVTVPAYVYIGVAPGQALTVTTGENTVNAKVITTVNGEVVDITTYYANGTSGTIAVTSGSAIDAGEFADEVVPAVSEETVNDTTVTFAVKNFKKGLYYGVAAGASPELGETGVTLTQCTDEQAGVPLTAAMPAEGVKYYKVVVSDTAE